VSTAAPLRPPVTGTGDHGEPIRSAPSSRRVADVPATVRSGHEHPDTVPTEDVWTGDVRTASPGLAAARPAPAHRLLAVSAGPPAVPPPDVPSGPDRSTSRATDGPAVRLRTAPSPRRVPSEPLSAPVELAPVADEVPVRAWPSSRAAVRRPPESSVAPVDPAAEPATPTGPVAAPPVVVVQQPDPAVPAGTPLFWERRYLGRLRARMLR